MNRPEERNDKENRGFFTCGELARLALFLVLLLPVSGSMGLAQNLSGERTAATFLFRMAQTERTRSTCTLVQETGAFHMERRSARGVDVFEGTMRPDRLAALKGMLEGEAFRRLAVDAPELSLQPTGLEEITLSLPRQGRWISVRFIAGLVPDRHQALLDQFGRWQGGVLKNPHKKLSEVSAGNNCLPPAPVELKPRGSQGSAPSAVP